MLWVPGMEGGSRRADVILRDLADAQPSSRPPEPIAVRSQAGGAPRSAALALVGLWLAQGGHGTSWEGAGVLEFERLASEKHGTLRS